MADPGMSLSIAYETGSRTGINSIAEFGLRLPQHPPCDELSLQGTSHFYTFLPKASWECYGRASTKKPHAPRRMQITQPALLHSYHHPNETANDPRHFGPHQLTLFTNYTHSLKAGETAHQTSLCVTTASLNTNMPACPGREWRRCMQMCVFFQKRK